MKDEPIRHVLAPTKEEILRKKLHLVYYPVKDTYEREFGEEKIDTGPEISVGWESMAKCEHNMSLKLEHDWGMTYLSRKPEDCATRAGFLAWKVDLTSKLGTVG